MPTKKTTTKSSPLDRILSPYADRIKETTAANLTDLPLFDFLEVASPHYQRPEHLESIVPYLDACERAPQKFAFSAPPRHGKSVLVNHFVARMMIRNPGIKIAYGCYGQKLSLFFSDEVKDILTSNGFEVDRNRNSREEWRLHNRSLFKAVAPGSDFTGRGADIIIIDDPYKSRVTAESGAVRESTWGWFTGVAITRRSPNASVIVTHTRWNGDDLIGRLTSKDHRHNWPYINLEAIHHKTKEPLWPGQFSLEQLTETRGIIGEYDWASLYMGQPRPRGGSVFGDPHTYGEEEHDVCELPKRFAKIYIGIDCAYTKRTYSDYSSAVVVGVGEDGRHYILQVLRVQCTSPVFAQHLKSLRMAWGCPPIYWYVGGTEKAIADFFIDTCGIPVKAIPAREDKFQRAQAVAAAWNAKKILMPSADTSWSSTFLNEVLSFTGLDDPHDDQVDALAAAYIPSAGKRVYRGTVDKPLMVY